MTVLSLVSWMHQ